MVSRRAGGGRCTRACGVAVAVALLLAGATGVRSAHAGTYVMRNCGVPGHDDALLGPWQPTFTAATLPNVSLIDRCATGGGVGFAIGGTGDLAVGTEVSIVLVRPPGPQSRITFVKAAVWYAARLASAGQPMNFVTYLSRLDGSVDPGVSNGPPGSESLVLEQQLGPITTQYHVGLHCGPLSGAPPPGTSCIPANGVPLLIRGMEVTLSEDVPPIVLQPTGTLLAGGPQRGTMTLAYAASDPQSGLAKIEVLLDDTVVASSDLTARCTYSDFTVCPDADDDTLQVDTRAVANGPHNLKLRVQDAAGNERVVDVAGMVEVANPPGSESTPAYTLTARFTGSSRASVSVPYGRRLVLRGRLAGGSSGAEIDVLERSDRRGARERTVGRVRTGADGSFSYGLATARPSRTVRLAYRPPGAREVLSKPLRLRVRAGSSLRASLRGRVIAFSGRVRSGPIPADGKLVRMEGRAPGSAWTVFRSLRTSRDGRFSGSYRLPIRRPGVKLEIRAYVPVERGYPYLGGRGRAVRLRVR